MFRNTIDTTQFLQRMDELKDVTLGTLTAIEDGTEFIKEAIERQIVTPLVFGSKYVQGDNETLVEINLARPRLSFHTKLVDIARAKRNQQITQRQRTWQEQALNIALMGRLEMVRFVNAEVDRRIPF